MVDILLLLLLVGAFVLGFVRGVVRQVLALGVWLVCFVMLAYLRVPVGSWLGDTMPQFSRDFATMVAFVGLFLLLFAGGLLLAQFGGAPAALTRHQLLDDVLGGVLGLVVAVVAVAALLVALDTYYMRVDTIQSGELGSLREVYEALDASTVVELVREWVVRGLGVILAPLLPADVAALMA